MHGAGDTSGGVAPRLKRRGLMTKVGLLMPLIALSFVVGSVVPADAHSSSTLVGTNNFSRFHKGFYQQGATGSTLSVSESSTRTVGVSGTLGVSKSIVEATIGFSIDSSTTLTWSTSRPTPDRTYCYGIVLYRRLQTKSVRNESPSRGGGHRIRHVDITRATGTSITQPTRRMSNGGDQWCS